MDLGHGARLRDGEGASARRCLGETRPQRQGGSTTAGDGEHAAATKRGRVRARVSEGAAAARKGRGRALLRRRRHGGQGGGAWWLWRGAGATASYGCDAGAAIWVESGAGGGERKEQLTARAHVTDKIYCALKMVTGQALLEGR